MLREAALYPAFAMVGMSRVDGPGLHASRVGGMPRVGTPPKAVAVMKRLSHPRAADDFRNLFEWPVLSCLAIVMAILRGAASGTWLATGLS